MHKRSYKLMYLTYHRPTTAITTHSTTIVAATFSASNAINAPRSRTGQRRGVPYHLLLDQVWCVSEHSSVHHVDVGQDSLPKSSA